MMITGDYHHTAVAVARDVVMLQSDSPIMIIDAVKNPQSMPEADMHSKVSDSATQTKLGHVVSALQPLLQSSADSASQSLSHRQSQGSLLEQPSVVSVSQPATEFAAVTQNWTQTVRFAPLQQSFSCVQQPAADAHSQTCSQAPMPIRRPEEAGQDMKVLNLPADMQQSIFDWSMRSGAEKARVSSDHAYGSHPQDFAAHPARQQSSLGSATNAHYATSSPLVSGQPLSSSTSSIALLDNPSSAPVAAAQPPEVTPPQPGVTPGRLCFLSGDSGEEWDSTKALTAMAEGQLKCAVTGDAFELLLQLLDQSVLEAVMQNVVVFA